MAAGEPAPLEFLSFRWWVHSEGVRVVRRAADEIGIHVEEGEAFLQPIGQRIRYYNPLDQRGELLEDFARASTEDDESCARLAARWGLLGIGPAVLRGGKVWGAELVSDWRAALDEWRDAFALFGACSERDQADYLTETIALPSGESAQRLLIHEGHAVYYGVQQIRELGGPRNRPYPQDSPYPQITPRKPRNAARLVLLEIFEEKLGAMVRFSPTVALATGAYGGRLRPRSLLGALWLALWDAASGGVHPRRCPRCREWFLANPAAERAHPREYCGATCRVEMSKKRGRARSLAADGMKAPSIAKALGQDVKTIRAWLRDSKRR